MFFKAYSYKNWILIRQIKFGNLDEANDFLEDMNYQNWLKETWKFWVGQLPQKALQMTPEWDGFTA